MWFRSTILQRGADLARNASNQIGWLVMSSTVCCSASASSLDYADYPKFPDVGDTRMLPTLDSKQYTFETQRQLQHFRDYLNKLNEAQQNLRIDCVHSLSRMTRPVRDRQVLIWPERFAECEAQANLLSNGDNGYEAVLRKLNATFSTGYAPPRGDAELLAAWSQTKAQITHFPNSDCDPASRKIVLYGEPGLMESPKQVFDAMKAHCPAEWLRLFKPMADTKAQKASDSRKNPPGGEDLDQELAGIEGGSYRAGKSSASNTESTPESVAALRAIQTQQGSAGLEAAVGAVLQNPTGPGGGIKIFGGENGKLLQQAAGVVEAQATGNAGPQQGGGSGCDDAVENQASVAMQERRAAAIRSLSFEQQQCALAKLYVDIYSRGLNYAERCKRQAEIPSIKSALSDSQKQARNLCR